MGETRLAGTKAIGNHDGVIVSSLRPLLRRVLAIVLAAMLPAAHAAAQSWGQDVPAFALQDRAIVTVGIVDEDDRRLSSFPYVANIGSGANSLGSGVVIGRRHLITAAHLFVRRGAWLATGTGRQPAGREYRAYRVFIEGCPTYTYGISKVFVNTTDPESYRKLDYAVVQLDQPHCGPSAALWSMNDDEVARYLYGEQPGEGPRKVTAVGYYGPPSVEHFDQSAVLETGTFADLRYTKNLAWQYAAEGFVVDGDHSQLFRDAVNYPQRILVHHIDSAIGGSGGPLLIRDGDENYVIGIHIGERRDMPSVNFAVPISDSFLALIVGHVPDAVIRRGSP